MKITDVTGVGSSAVFLIQGKANILFEAGMAYAADQMIKNIENELDGGELDAVLLSHSHYDHVAGLPLLRKRFPHAKVYASQRAKEILTKPSALATIKRLSGEAAEAAGIPFDENYSDSSLSVDIGLKDGDKIQIGGFQVEVLETIGHTKCSISYIVDEELMLCSETVGVLGPQKQYMPSFLVDYLEMERSISRSSRIPVRQIILNHYGLVLEADMPHIWEDLLSMARDSKQTMTKVMRQYDTEEACLEALDAIYHVHIDKKDQPDEAFNINAVSMMKTLRRQFPEEFESEPANKKVRGKANAANCSS